MPNHNISSPTGNKITCKNWQIEAPYRMIQNNLDSSVAENPDDLVVYGGKGKAARDWKSFKIILKTLQRLNPDETLLVQSGKPVGVVRTHISSPRVLIANSNLVPEWANWNHFNSLDREGLMMYGQMTAGSWIYIGTQGILQGTYETFAAAAKKHYNSDLNGKIVVTAGLGGMGGAQPLAVKMNNGIAICIEVDPSRINRRIETKYLDTSVKTLDEAIIIANQAKNNKEAITIGLEGNAADIVPKMVELNFVPDMITDQTSAHDELDGYIPNGLSIKESNDLRKSDSKRYISESYKAMVTHCEAIIKLQAMGSIAFDYGNNLRGQAKKAGLKNAFDFPGFIPEYIRP
ncbi:MAG: urocanate hydratase, partial [Candidatus Neomarinimicrobiota bacterium]|nr:urocanate hydratase [Candidatus Neomarinimicrobiota bacterium]